jgi:hypothetical protein
MPIAPERDHVTLAAVVLLIVVVASPDESVHA